MEKDDTNISLTDERSFICQHEVCVVKSVPFTKVWKASSSEFRSTFKKVWSRRKLSPPPLSILTTLISNLDDLTFGLNHSKFTRTTTHHGTILFFVVCPRIFKPGLFYFSFNCSAFLENTRSGWERDGGPNKTLFRVLTIALTHPQVKVTVQVM